jgi:8-amino-7-oxononanoate synthase
MDCPVRQVRAAMKDFEGALRDLRDSGLYRELRVIESAQGPRVKLSGRDVILLCSNDYLGLAGHPALRAAAAEAALEWGAGAGASRLVSGNMALHARLESELALFKGYERCVLFGSGFLANLGVIASLAGPEDVILSDELNHASIIDGCRQSRAETIIYRHSDMESLEQGLHQAGSRPAVIVTDAVFSMDGDLAQLTQIVELARGFRARVIVDEAHATGVVGPAGRGLVAALGLEGEIDVVVGTLGKALGSYGAFVCCRAAVAEFLVNRARTLIYSTALPPPAVAAAHSALDLLREERELMQRLWRNARTLRSELAGRALTVEPDRGEMPIVPIVIGDPVQALEASEQALRQGVFAQAIRPPTVPDGTSRLRAVATAAHSEDDLRYAARVLAGSVRAAQPPATPRANAR